MSLTCEKCGHNRWKTVQKKRVFLCRKCGYTRYHSVLYAMQTNKGTELIIGCAMVANHELADHPARRSQATVQ